MKLPDSWVVVPIASVCEINPKIKAEEKPKDDTIVSFVPMSAVDENNATIAHPELKKYLEVSKGYTYFKSGDVLFAKVTPCMENGKAAIARELENGLGFGSTEFHVLRPLEMVLPEYILFFIRQPLFREYARSAFMGTGGLQRVPPRFFKQAKIPLPTLTEQHQIVEIIEQAEDISHLRILRIDKLNELIELHLEKLLIYKKDFEEVRLGRVCETKYGTSVSPDADIDSGLPVLRIPNVIGGEVDDSDLKYVNLPNSDADKLLLTKTDALVVRSNGNPDYVGRSAPITAEIEDKKYVYASYLIRLRFNPEYALPEFVSAFLNSRYGRAVLRNSIRTTAGQSNLSAGALSKITIPLPRLSVQSRFADYWRQVSDIRNLIGDTSKLSAKLNEALAQLAFTGRLTENWRLKNDRTIQKAFDQRKGILTRIKRLNLIPSPAVSSLFSSHVDLKVTKKKSLKSDRYSILNELSTFQRSIRNALQKQNRMLIPDDSASLDRFCNELRPENDTNLQDRVLRALDQLTAMGLIAKVSLPNEQGHYLNCFRMLREGESRRIADIQTVNDAMKRFEVQKAAE